MQPWMTYHFFTKVPHAEIPELQTNVVTSACSCHGSLLFAAGQETSEIYGLNGYEYPASQIGLTFPGPVVYMAAAQFSQRLLIVTKEQGVFVFRIYNYQNFVLRYEMRCPGENIYHIAVSPKLTRIAFTMNKREFLIYTLPKVDKHTEKCTKLPNKPTYSYTMNSEITAIFLTNDKHLKKYAYVACENEVDVFRIDGKIKMVQIDKDGFKPLEGQNVATVDPEGQLYLCRLSTVTVYNKDGKLKKELTLDIERPQMLFWFRQYLVAAGKPDLTLVKVYELESHCVFGVVAGSPNYTNVKFMFSEWSKLNLVLEDGTLIVLNEPSTETKISQLCGKFNQFDVALSLAQSQSLDPSVLAGIHHSKGDQYYERHNYEEAIREYIQAIGSLESSYVIKKFLDPQHAHYLIEYLEVLQEKEAATNSSTKRLQTTLLFNCYTKLRREEQIRKRIREAVDGLSQGKEPNFDVEAAIDVLNRGGYFEECSNLAKAFSKHEIYMKLLSDAGKYRDLADYFPSLPVDVANVAVLKYGPVLLEHLDEKDRKNFASLVVKFCTVGQIEVDSDGNQVKRTCQSDLFRTVFALHPNIYFTFLNNLVAADAANVSESLWNDYLVCAIRVSPKELPSIMVNPAARYSTEQAMIVFKEASLSLDDEIKAAQKEAGDQPSERVKALNAKHDYLKAAMRVLYEKRKLYMEILSLALPEELPDYCEEYSEFDPGIWKEGLRLAILSKNKDSIRRLLALIFEKKVMPLNSVLPLFARSIDTFELLQSYAEAGLQQLMEEIAEREATLAKLDQQLEESEKVVRSLSTEYYTMNPKCRCRGCNLQLSAPCRHFFCGDAFDLRCLGDETQVCSICKDSHIQNAQRKLDVIAKTKQEVDVLAQLEEADDPLEALNIALQAGHFWPEVEQGGEDEINSFISRIKDPPIEMPEQAAGIEHVYGDSF